MCFCKTKQHPNSHLHLHCNGRGLLGGVAKQDSGPVAGDEAFTDDRAVVAGGVVTNGMSPIYGLIKVVRAAEKVYLVFKDGGRWRHLVTVEKQWTPKAEQLILQLLAMMVNHSCTKEEAVMLRNMVLKEESEHNA
eukprot:5835499-Alexandrium_andersonii.AAC.1